MAVHVNRVMPCRVVDQLEHVRTPKVQRNDRRVLMVVLRHGNAVHGPEQSPVLALRRHRAHHAAAEDDAMPLRAG